MPVTFQLLGILLVSILQVER